MDTFCSLSPINAFVVVTAFCVLQFFFFRITNQATTHALLKKYIHHHYNDLEINVKFHIDKIALSILEF